MKKICFCLAVLTVLFFTVSCGSKSSDTKTAEKSDNDSIATETDNDNDSGNTEAADNDAAHGDKTDSGDSSDSADSSDSSDTADSGDSSDSGDTADSGDSSDSDNPVTVKVNFETSCEASGGTIVNDRCVCNDEVCKAGIVCNFNKPHGCADNSSTECPDKTPVCKNDETTFVGKLSSCNSSNVYEEKSCKGDVSCKNDKECGACLNYKHVCSNDPNTGFGTVYECQEGRSGKFVAECKDGNDNRVSCRMQKAILRDENGEAILDEHGYASFIKDEEATAEKGYQVYKMESLDVCGECVEHEIKCVNDLSENAVMYRCIGGIWQEITSSSDSASLWNNPDLGKIQLTGYYPPSGKVETFWTSLMGPHDENLNRHVSCNAEGTWYGDCHNSVQYCINQERGKRGFIIKCENGVVADYDGNHDNIACTCVESGNNYGGCSSSRNCYAAQTAASGVKICQPATYNPDGEVPGN